MEYRRSLRRVVRAAIKAGYEIAPDEYNRLAEIAIKELAARFKVTLPPRVPKHGTNRFTPKAGGGKP